MKLFKKKNSAAEEQTEEKLDGASRSNEALEENDAAAVSEEAEKEATKRDLRFALIRCAAALILAAVLLLVSGFSIVDLAGGPVEYQAFEEAEPGSFVKCEISAIIGLYGENEELALVPGGRQYVTVRFTGRYDESVRAVVEETEGFLAGNIYPLDKYVVVQGTVETLDEEQSALLKEWLELNREALISKGVASETIDMENYVSDKVLLVDTVNGKSQTLVFILTGAAALLVLYIIAEFIMMALGLYKNKKEKPEESLGEDKDEQGVGKAAPEQAQQASNAANAANAAKGETWVTSAENTSEAEPEEKQ